MKKILFTLFLAVCVTVAAFAQNPYFTRDQMPDPTFCLPAPPDTVGADFDHDLLRYMWGKQMRLNPARARQARRDAIWNLDTLAAIFSEPFGLEISREGTPEIYRAFVNGVATIEQVRVKPKAHYMRIRPFVRYNEHTLFPDDDEELSHEGSYPSGHTIRGWGAALVLAEINPDAAEELYRRAWIYGENRVIVGAHWQSDVDASRAVASIGYSFLQTSAAYRRQMDKARAELQALRPRPAVADGLLNLQDTLSLGLARCPGAQWIRLTAARSEVYVNNVLLTKFKGKYYCMWQQSARDEDSPDTRVMYAASNNGKHWSKASLLAPPMDSTFVSPGGWIQRGDSLVAVLNYVCAADRSQGGSAWYSASRDGRSWGAPRPLRMADGKPMQGILEQDPLLLESGRTVGAAHFQPGLKAWPVYTDDPSALRGWKKAVFHEGEGEPLEPSPYLAPDGRLVMFFRDQASSFRKLYSLSMDAGEHWTVPLLSDIPDSRSKQCAGTLPDGRTFWVGNPTGSKSRRVLVLALSTDGYHFDEAYLLAGPEDLPPRQFAGRYKTLGYNYPKATVLDGSLWIACSLNKEEAALIQIPLTALRTASPSGPSWHR